MSNAPRIDDPVGRRALAQRYRADLLDDCLPFWMRHAIDEEHGGFLFALDAGGAVWDTDKGIWQHARFTWLLATLARDLADGEPGRADDYRRLAEHGIRFLDAHALVRDDPERQGRMWFQVTRDGRPLRMRRYFFTECFGAMAFAAWSRLSGDEAAARTARELFRTAVDGFTVPGRIPPKGEPATRELVSLGPPMILLNVAQVFRDAGLDVGAEQVADDALTSIGERLLNEELGCLFECVDPDGGFVDCVDGRTLNPGHALEAAWFVLEEARRRGGDERLLDLGVRIADLTWPWAWDTEHGGILYFRDALGRPVQEYWHDMKFWWPHNEAVLANLFAYQATGERRFADRHADVHAWAHAHFPDPEHGEWFGYLHRDGTRSSDAKGNLWKGPFHLPRMQWRAWRLLESMD